MKPFAFFAAASALLATSVWAQQPATPTATTDSPLLCAITGETIKDTASAAGKSEFKGKTYYFCCPGCVTKFDKADDAAKNKFAKLTELRTEKVVLGRKLQALDGEIATLEGKPAPTKTAKLTTDLAKSAAVKPVAANAPAAKTVYCAVTGEEIGTPDKAAVTVKYNNKDYYLCCPGCQGKWDKDPAKFAAEADKRAKN